MRSSSSLAAIAVVLAAFAVASSQALSLAELCYAQSNYPICQLTRSAPFVPPPDHQRAFFDAVSPGISLEEKRQAYGLRDFASPMSFNPAKRSSYDFIRFGRSVTEPHPEQEKKAAPNKYDFIRFG